MSQHSQAEWTRGATRWIDRTDGGGGQSYVPVTDGLGGYDIALVQWDEGDQDLEENVRMILAARKLREALDMLLSETLDRDIADGGPLSLREKAVREFARDVIDSTVPPARKEGIALWVIWENCIEDGEPPEKVTFESDAELNAWVEGFKAADGLNNHSLTDKQGAIEWCEKNEIEFEDDEQQNSQESLREGG